VFVSPIIILLVVTGGRIAMISLISLVVPMLILPLIVPPAKGNHGPDRADIPESLITLSEPEKETKLSVVWGSLLFSVFALPFFSTLVSRFLNALFFAYVSDF